MRYQKIVGATNRIANAIPFGRRLRRFLREPGLQQLAAGQDWRSDGAWVLADAMNHWSNGGLRVAALVRPDQQLAHIVAEEPSLGLYLDADGVASRLELMSKMAMLMREPAVNVADFSPLDARLAGISYDEEIAVELTLRLLRRFGRYSPELLTLPERIPS